MKGKTLDYSDRWGHHCNYCVFLIFFPAEARAKEQLEQFSDSLSKFTKFSSMRPLATLSYADVYNGSSIVSR